MELPWKAKLHLQALIYHQVREDLTHREEFTLTCLKRVITWPVHIVKPSSQLWRPWDDTSRVVAVRPTIQVRLVLSNVGSTLRFYRQSETTCHQLFCRVQNIWGCSIAGASSAIKISHVDRNWSVTYPNSTQKYCTRVTQWQIALLTFVEVPTTPVFVILNAQGFDQIRDQNIGVLSSLRLLPWWKWTRYRSTTPSFRWISGTLLPLKLWGPTHQGHQQHKLQETRWISTSTGLRQWQQVLHSRIRTSETSLIHLCVHLMVNSDFPQTNPLHVQWMLTHTRM